MPKLYTSKFSVEENIYLMPFARIQIEYRKISKMCYNFNGIINTRYKSRDVREHVSVFKVKEKTITLTKSYNISP